MTKIIGTHDGSFHADESFACFMLRKTKEFAGAKIVRSRDPAVLAPCDVVVDVGAVYDPSKHRYDHHQKEFQDTMVIGDKKYATRLSSAGLIYKHFGHEVICNLCDWDIKKDADKIDIVFKKVYEDFVEAMDGIDNGVSNYPPEIKPKYIDNTGLAARVGRLMPWWNATEKADYDVLFEKAVALVGSEFTERVQYTAKSWLYARDIVENALESSKGSRVLVFDSFCPWKEHLFQLEEEMKVEEAYKPLYVVYPDESGKWRVQAVPISPGSFESRQPLPESWRGLRDQQLSDCTGIPDCIFVHASGFIGGNQTRDGALKMAMKAILPASSA